MTVIADATLFNTLIGQQALPSQKPPYFNTNFDYHSGWKSFNSTTETDELHQKQAVFAVWVHLCWSHDLVWFQAVLLIESVQDGQLLPHSWQVEVQISMHSGRKALLQLIAFMRNQCSYEALIGRGGP